jgi:hypothetical protein
MYAPLLVELLSPHPKIRIVLSTTWVRRYGCAGAARNLPDTLSDRVIGATWHSDNKHFQEEWSSAPRGRQVWGDVQRRLPSNWVAVDDDVLDWPSDARQHLVQSDPVLGISCPTVQMKLKLKLAHLGEQS